MRPQRTVECVAGKKRRLPPLVGGVERPSFLLSEAARSSLLRFAEPMASMQSSSLHVITVRDCESVRDDTYVRTYTRFPSLSVVQSKHGKTLLLSLSSG